jgi:integrase
LDLERFTADVTNLAAKMTVGESEEIIMRMDFVKSRLIELYKRNIVKINHSAMELVCARHLIRYDYAVDVERQLNDILICDLYATKGDGEAIVEIETGFIPPEHALDPLSYYSARVASKIARYSKFANQFVLATPPVSVLPIPKLFRRPPRDRGRDEINRVKELCDRYYRNPPVSFNEILNSHLHMIYIINVDQGKVTEMDIDSYFDAVEGMSPNSTMS